MRSDNTRDHAAFDASNATTNDEAELTAVDSAIQPTDDSSIDAAECAAVTTADDASD